MIMRPLIILTFATFFSLIVFAIPVPLQMEALPVLALPFVLVYAVFLLTPLEGAIIAAILGIIYDLMTGASVGVWMSLALTLWLLAKVLSRSAGRLHGPLLFFFILGISFLVRIFALILFSIFGDNQANWEWYTLLMGPCLDALVGTPAFKLLHMILIRARLAEPMDDVGQRLQARRS